MKSTHEVAGKRMGWKNIIGEANKLLFVGRVQEIHLFRQYIACIPPNSLIFYITGKAWVGKTTLLNYCQTIALENNFILAECDERHKDILTILGHFAMQLRAQKHPLKNFENRYKTYRQKMYEIENDPEAPRGWTDLIGRWGVRVAYTLGHSIAATQNGLSYFPPQEALETQVSEWGGYLANKFRKHEDLSLMREPETVLTQLFLRDLNSIARNQKILLCFENFEQTRPVLQEWFLHLHEYDPSPNIRIALAGRTPPGSQWEPLHRMTTTIALDVFSQQEAEQFLDNREISDQHHRNQILTKSERLPMIMSLLAAPTGHSVNSSLEKDDLAELFLGCIDDPALQEIVLLAAVPPTFNKDVLEALLTYRKIDKEPEWVLVWLLDMPFIEPRSDGWRYKKNVRRSFLDYQRRRSPETYREIHAELARFHQNSGRLPPWK